MRKIFNWNRIWKKITTSIDTEDTYIESQHTRDLLEEKRKHSGTLKPAHPSFFFFSEGVDITFTADSSRSRNRRVKIKITALPHEAGGKLAVFRKLAWKEATQRPQWGNRKGGKHISHLRRGEVFRHHWCMETADEVSSALDAEA